MTSDHLATDRLELERLEHRGQALHPDHRRRAPRSPPPDTQALPPPPRLASGDLPRLRPAATRRRKSCENAPCLDQLHQADLLHEDISQWSCDRCPRCLETGRWRVSWTLSNWLVAGAADPGDAGRRFDYETRWFLDVADDETHIAAPLLNRPQVAFRPAQATGRFRGPSLPIRPARRRRRQYLPFPSPSREHSCLGGGGNLEKPPRRGCDRTHATISTHPQPAETPSEPPRERSRRRAVH